MIEVMLNQAVEQHVSGFLFRSPLFIELALVQFLDGLAQARPAIAEMLERSLPFHFTSLPYRRPIHFLGHCGGVAGQPVVNDGIPGSDVIHKLPNGVSVVDGML